MPNHGIVWLPKQPHSLCIFDDPECISYLLWPFCLFQQDKISGSMLISVFSYKRLFFPQSWNHRKPSLISPVCDLNSEDSHKNCLTTFFCLLWSISGKEEEIKHCLIWLFGWTGITICCPFIFHVTIQLNMYLSPKKGNYFIIKQPTANFKSTCLCFIQIFFSPIIRLFYLFPFSVHKTN